MMIKNILFKAKRVDAKGMHIAWVQGWYFKKEYIGINNVHWIFPDDNHGKDSIDVETLSMWIDTPETNIKGLWLNSDIFEFEFNDPITKESVILIGVMTFDDLELRYQIDIYSKEHHQYACLYFNPETMSNFKVIGNTVDNPELIGQ